MKKWLISLVVLISLFNVSALIYNVECDNKGSLEITLNSINDSKIYTEDIKTKVDGKTLEYGWGQKYLRRSTSADKQYATLKTDEATFNEKESYNLEINYKITLENGDKDEITERTKFECPGLFFSCALINITLEDCYTEDDIFKTYLKVTGLKQSDVASMDLKDVVDYKIVAEKNYLDVNGLSSKKGILPKDYELRELDNERYILEAPFKDNNVKTFWVGFNNNLVKPCKWDSYNSSYYAYGECGVKVKEVEKVEDIEEVVEEENIEDVERVVTDNQVIDVNKVLEFSRLKFLIYVIIVVLILASIILIVLHRRGLL